ncbi:unnamed protein product [Didymodactylos carnosus]|uniref:Uncharacterized protein n=1 Tax=Didymodactylos carnosus TaxID=1234261 RepID=A0A815RA16_9BILA|nr:unnamed protein product [Didymodactylos carnosus]CAF4341239.1 unnamed protein product [Didymodactylos carnosus]
MSTPENVESAPGGTLGTGGTTGNLGQAGAGQQHHQGNLGEGGAAQYGFLLHNSGKYSLTSEDFWKTHQKPNFFSLVFKDFIELHGQQHHQGNLGEGGAGQQHHQGNLGEGGAGQQYHQGNLGEGGAGQQKHGGSSSDTSSSHAHDDKCDAGCKK